jgi:serine/threonine-protein kinase
MLVPPPTPAAPVAAAPPGNPKAPFTIPGYELGAELDRKPSRGKLYEAVGPAGPCSVRVIDAHGIVDRGKLDAIGRAYAKVHEPALLRLLDWGTVRFVTEHVYFVEELARGPDLKYLAEVAGPLATPLAAKHAASIASLLEWLDKFGVPYRLPLMPSGVLLENGVLRLTELEPESREWCTTPPNWGMAGAVGAASLSAQTSFMAPETMESGSRDERTAVHSVGALLYFMLVGKAPNEGKSAMDVMMKSLREDPHVPSPFAANDRVLRGICERCLRRDPTQRYPTLSDLAGAISFLVLSSPEERRGADG